jgi:hypothetical protein
MCCKFGNERNLCMPRFIDDCFASLFFVVICDGNLWHTTVEGTGIWFIH